MGSEDFAGRRNQINFKMNVLITGGAGYIGTVLTEELLKMSNAIDKIYVLDNLSYKQESCVPFCLDEVFRISFIVKGMLIAFFCLVPPDGPVLIHFMMKNFITSSHSFIISDDISLKDAYE